MVKLHLLCDGLFVTSMRTFLPEGPAEMYPAAAKSLLIETEKEKILVDTGIADLPEGPRFDYLRNSLTIKRPRNLGIKKQLAKRGIAPSEITSVINTHLHAAHCGHNDLFTNATIYIAKSEFRFFYNLTEDDPKKLVYVPNNFEKLKNVEEVSGEYKLNENVKVLPTPGHTLGHQSVIIHVDGHNLVYSGDVSPLKANLQGEIAMVGYDRPLILEQMRKLLEIKNAKWIFAHDSAQLSMRTAYSPRKSAA